MPSQDKPCDIYQGYNFKKDKQNRVGFLQTLKIGSIVFTPDQTAKDPLQPTVDLKVVGVLSHVNWDMGNTDAVYFSGQCSTAAKQALQAIKINDLVDIQTTLKFTVYEFDPLAKLYFKAFHSNEVEMLGLIEKETTSGDLTLDVAEERSTEVQSPENYTFYVGFKPLPQSQQLHIATSNSNKIVKQFGFTVSA